MQRSKEVENGRFLNAETTYHNCQLKQVFIIPLTIVWVKLKHQQLHWRRSVCVKQNHYQN